MSVSVQDNSLDILVVQALCTFLFIFLHDIAERYNVPKLALCWYEWFVTLDQEIKHIWTRKWTISTWVFAVNRYATMFLVVLQLLPTPNHICFPGSERSHLAIETSSYFSSSSASILSLPSPTWWYSSNKLSFSQNLTRLMCAKESCRFPPLQNYVSLGTQIVVILADVIVLAITWKSALGTMREASRLKIKTPLSMVLVRDDSRDLTGTCFFFTTLRALLVINVLLILSTNIPALVTISSAGSTLGGPLSSIIVSRFLLNLKQAGSSQGSNVSNTGTMLRMSAVHFNSEIFVGNLGESLDLGIEDEVDGADLDGMENLNEVDCGQVEEGSSNTLAQSSSFSTGNV
ncbi:hypothetical protein BDY19DRAFT_910114 [Irpex rosettiformis]|uniref:Uncharacterized protein n=1 Tax=Irpex rosettiformis TaxID=378272 RepID=A0ACB8TPP4_9APHY|nr:hypothetical protein BDY19DRAFT_910114 [Irpex rosettiformis]